VHNDNAEVTSCRRDWERAVGDLWGVAQKCSSSDWDGYGADPVKEETGRLARSFLEALPRGKLAPAVSAETDGHLTFEWYRSDGRTLSVSLSFEGKLHYSALLGHDKVFGTEPFVNDIPRSILDLIERMHSA
jgi:hypothetical protein